MKFFKRFTKKKAQPNPNAIDFTPSAVKVNVSWASIGPMGAPTTDGKVNFEQMKVANYGAPGLTTNSFVPFQFSRGQMRQAAILNRLTRMLEYPDWVNYTDLQWMFVRHPVAFNICTTYPRYCWNPRPIVLEMDNKTNTPESEFELACAAIADKINLYREFERLDVAAQIGQYGVLYIDFADGDMAESAPESAKPAIEAGMANPVTSETYNDPPMYANGLDRVKWEVLKNKKADAINYVVVYQQANAWPTQYVADANRPSYPLVSYYNLQSGGQVFGATGQTNNMVYGAALPIVWNVVHASRCIHLCDHNVSNNILGIPALQPVFDDLLNSLRVGGGSAMVFQNNARGGLSISIDQKENQSIDAADVATFKAQVEAYLEGYSRSIVLDGIEVKTLNFTVAAPDKHMAVYMQNISAGCGIPQRILLGNEAGRLASDEDSKNFARRVKSRQEGYCANAIRRFFDPLIENGVIPAPKSGTYKIHFPILDINDNSQNATDFAAVVTAVAAAGNSKSVDVENAIPDLIAKGNEILKITKDRTDIPATENSYAHPDTTVEDLEKLRGKGDGVEVI